ncbi:MAG TPA: chromate transporter [Desulfuromonadales bacterium]|nr:chromate transporter [Desulfuromonadales bacterium]
MLLWKIFVLFSRVSLFSWGGGPASLALMQRETTAATWLPPGAAEVAPWTTPLEFSDAVAVGNALPGPIAPQVSAYIGYKMAGLPGAIAAAAGTVLPTTILMLIMVVYFFRIKDSLLVQSMLKTVRPVVVGLLLWTAYDMAYSVFGVKRLGWGSSLNLGWDKILIVAVTFGLLTMTKVNPALVILGAACAGGVLYR